MKQLVLSRRMVMAYGFYVNPYEMATQAIRLRYKELITQTVCTVDVCPNLSRFDPCDHTKPGDA